MTIARCGRFQVRQTELLYEVEMTFLVGLGWRFVPSFFLPSPFLSSPPALRLGLFLTFQTWTVLFQVPRTRLAWGAWGQDGGSS